MDDKSIVYFVEKPFFKEAIMTLAFKDKVNWLEEGMSLMSWEYRKIAKVDEINPDKIYHQFKRWKGNKRAHKAGHRTISIGDIIITGANVRIVTGKGWEKVPDIIWKKISKI